MMGTLPVGRSVARMVDRTDPPVDMAVGDIAVVAVGTAARWLGSFDRNKGSSVWPPLR
jgi:hypothetical protein